MLQLWWCQKIMATAELLKIKVYWNKNCDVIIFFFFYGATKKRYHVNQIICDQSLRSLEFLGEKLL